MASLPQISEEGVHKTRGYSSYGLALPRARFGSRDFSLEAERAAGAEFLALAPYPTAVISTSDQLAIGLASALHTRGLRVPDDVSLIGFDDIQTADFVFPPLTTVRQDRLRLGAQAAALLLRQLAGGQLCPGQSCHAASVASGPGNDIRPQRERLTGDSYSCS